MNGMGDVVGDIATVMIGVQYIGYLLLAGFGLLLSLLLPIPFAKARAVLGILCLLAAAVVFVWLYAGTALGMIG